MTAQPETAVGSEAPVPAADASNPFEDIANEMLPQADEEEDAPPEGDEPNSEPDETDLEEEVDELPPIDPPVSLTAEEKEAFKALPRDAQEFTARRIGELEKGFNAKAQEAAQARQAAERDAQTQLAEYDARVSQHLNSLAEQLQPQRPNPQLLQYDPQAFYAQQAQYEADVAQRQELQQRAEHHANQAQARAVQAEQVERAEQHRILVEQFPEYLDPTTSPKLQAELSAVARELGYPPELIGQARATDIIAMRKVAELKAKADKYDALQSKKMEKVRSAKGLPKVATPGVSQGSDQVRAQRAKAAWETVKSAKSRNARDEAAATWMENSGWL